MIAYNLTKYIVTATYSEDEELEYPGYFVDVFKKESNTCQLKRIGNLFWIDYDGLEDPKDNLWAKGECQRASEEFFVQDLGDLDSLKEVYKVVFQWTEKDQEEIYESYVDFTKEDYMKDFKSRLQDCVGNGEKLDIWIKKNTNRVFQGKEHYIIDSYTDTYAFLMKEEDYETWTKMLNENDITQYSDVNTYPPEIYYQDHCMLFDIVTKGRKWLSTKTKEEVPVKFKARVKRNEPDKQD